jgi:hypothetical protein
MLLIHSFFEKHPKAIVATAMETKETLYRKSRATIKN